MNERQAVLLAFPCYRHLIQSSVCNGHALLLFKRINDIQVPSHVKEGNLNIVHFV